MSRRQILAGAGGLAASMVTPVHAAPDVPAPAVRRTDGGDGRRVVVIGAGAAGLAAAERLVQAGYGVTVLEARNRLGGRAFTDAVAGRIFDAGAAYVHFRERNPWVEIAQRLNVELREHRGWGNGAGYDGTVRLDDGFRRARNDARRALWRRMEDVDVDEKDISMADLAAGGDAAEQWVATRYAQQAIGEQPENVSIADISVQWEGDDYTVPGGYGSLVSLSGSGLPVSMDTPATLVRWGRAGVQVETPRGTVGADRVVVTVPVGVLASGRLRFDPALPAAQARAIESLRAGALTKVALALDGERFGLSSPSDFFELKSGFVFECFPFDRDLVIATIGGEPARALIRQGEGAAVSHAVEVLAGILGEGLRRHVVGGRLSDWVTDPWALGSYSVARPGHLKDRDALARPVGDRLFYAGEATAGGGSMTVGGATLAGRAAAEAIIRLG